MNSSTNVAIATVAALFLGGCATAGRSSAPSAPSPVQPSNIFLWQVSKDDLPGRGYVLGSVHVRKPDAALDEAIWAALESADVVVGELSKKDKAEAANRSQFVLQQGMLPPGQRLEQLIDTETYELLKKRTTELKVPLLMFERMRPWLAAISLVATKLALDNYKADAGVDQVIENRAAELGIENRGMETPEQQIRLFSGLPLSLQNALLKDSLLALAPERRGETDLMFDAYRKGDAARLAMLTFSERLTRPDLAVLYERIFDDRNMAMTSCIATYLQEPKTIFVVAGVGHLLGEQGIPQLLADRGFRVRPVAGRGLRPPPEPPEPPQPPASPTAAATPPKADEWTVVDITSLSLQMSFPDAPKATETANGAARSWQLARATEVLQVNTFETRSPDEARARIQLGLAQIKAQHTEGGLQSSVRAETGPDGQAWTVIEAVGQGLRSTSKATSYGRTVLIATYVRIGELQDESGRDAEQTRFFSSIKRGL